MKILVSACLLGHNCKYNGKNNHNEGLVTLLRGHQVIPVCPEEMGGLSTPRDPAELVDGVVTTVNGVSVDGAFRRGARATVDVARQEQVDLAILQSRSPSCGVHEVYDGSFQGRRIPGKGLTAQALVDAGFHVVDVEDVYTLDFLEKDIEKHV